MDQIGMTSGQSDRGHTAEGHTHHPAGAGGQHLHRSGHVLGHRTRIEGAPVARPVRMAMPGEIQGHQRAIESQGHRVPGMGVLTPTVEEDQIGGTGSPDQGTHPPPRRHLHRLAPHRRRTVPGQPGFTGVLLEQRELVVGRRRMVGPWIRSCRQHWGRGHRQHLLGLSCS